MDVVFKSPNRVAVSWAQALLREQGMEPVVLDAHMSALYGHLPLLPMRLAVEEE